MSAALLLVLGCSEDAGTSDAATVGSEPVAPGSASAPTPEVEQTGSVTVAPPPAPDPAPEAPASSSTPGPAEPEPDATPGPAQPEGSTPRPVRPMPEPEPGPSPAGGGAGGDGGAVGEPAVGGGGTGGSGASGGAGAQSAMAGASSVEPEPLEGCEDGPLDAPIPGCEPEFDETGDFYEDCVARINQLRWECQCLPPLERWVEAEDCADQQAEYDYNQDQAHAGIRAGICEPGGGSQNECPDYTPNFDVVNFCLQQMWDEGPGEDFQAHGHYINMSSTTVTKVACGLYETPEGRFWSVQNFSR